LANWWFIGQQQYKYRHIAIQTDRFSHPFLPKTVCDWNDIHSETFKAPSLKKRLYPSFVGVIFHTRMFADYQAGYHKTILISACPLRVEYCIGDKPVIRPTVTCPGPARSRWPRDRERSSPSMVSTLLVQSVVPNCSATSGRSTEKCNSYGIPSMHV